MLRQISGTDDGESGDSDSPLVSTEATSRSFRVRVLAVLTAGFFVLLLLALALWPSAVDDRGSSVAEVEAVDVPSRLAHTCVLHVAFGEDFIKLAEELTLPNKRYYASTHGYELKVYQQPTFEGLISQSFGSCDGGTIKTDRILSMHAVLKFCAISAAFEDGCDTVLWLDADAVIHSHNITVDDWILRNPNADVYWSLSNDQPGCSTVARVQMPGGPGGCAAFGSLGRTILSCLNTGVFIMRRTPWTRTFINEMLQLSHGDHEDKLKCSTGPADPLTYNVCERKPHGQYRDQCLLACDTLANRRNIEHYECFGGILERPAFQMVYHLPSETMIPADTFAVNCDCGGKQKLHCMRQCLHSAVDAGPVGALSSW